LGRSGPSPGRSPADRFLVLFAALFLYRFFFVLCVLGFWSPLSGNNRACQFFVPPPSVFGTPSSPFRFLPTSLVSTISPFQSFFSRNCNTLLVMMMTMYAYLFSLTFTERSSQFPISHPLRPCVYHFHDVLFCSSPFFLLAYPPPPSHFSNLFASSPRFLTLCPFSYLY